MSNVKVVFRASDTTTDTAENGSRNGFVWQCGFELWPVRSFQKHQ